MTEAGKESDAPRDGGGPGWSVRQPASPQTTAGGYVPPFMNAPPPPLGAPAPPFITMPPPPPSTLTPFLAPPPPWMPLQPHGSGIAARWAVVGAVGVAVLVAVLLVLSTLGAATSSSATALPTSAAAVPGSAVRTTAGANPRENPAVVAQAGHEYLAAVGPVNTAEAAFRTALATAQSQPCTCPAGEFKAGAAVALIPGINGDLEAFQVVLQKLRTELPDLAPDIDACVADNQREMTEFAAIVAASQKNDGIAASNHLNSVLANHVSATPDFARLRADLGLPPPS